MLIQIHNRSELYLSLLSLFLSPSKKSTVSQALTIDVQPVLGHDVGRGNWASKSAKAPMVTQQTQT